MRALSLAAVLVSFVTMSLAGASEPLLPFRVPDGWKAAPESFASRTLNWRAAGSTFTVMAGPDESGSKRLRSMLPMGEAATACGQPALRLTTNARARKMVEIEQVSSIGERPYVWTYSHPRAQPADPRIVSLFSTLCTTSAIADAQPPTGWIAGGRIVGMWLGLSQADGMTLIAGPPVDVREKHPSDWESVAIPGGTIRVEPSQTRTLCGLRATVVVSHIEKQGSEPEDVLMERTHLGTVEYTLMYTHLTSSRDPKAEAALASLCAKPKPLPSPSPLSASSP